MLKLIILCLTSNMFTSWYRVLDKKRIIKNFIISFFFLCNALTSQVFFSADSYYRLIQERKQFYSNLPFSPIFFKPYFFNYNDSTYYNLNLRSEFYLNNNAPNQENMDVRYFSKGYFNYSSLKFSLNHKYLYLIFEPYLKLDKTYKFEEIERYGPYTRLNDYRIDKNLINDKSIRSFLFFLHYKGIGFGLHKGNRWWGPGYHSSLQMTNNTWPIMSQIIGTLKEIKIRNFGFMGFHSFSNLDDKYSLYKKYHTALNGQLNWYGPVTVSLGFSRNYLSGGIPSVTGRVWSAKDAKLLVFESFLTNNLVKYDYTEGGHDRWDQTLSGYFTILFPDRNFKIYAEVGFNDNRMFFADLLSQPDHTMATIIGFRDYGINNWVYGLEWTNMMLSYTIRFRKLAGTPEWYNKNDYNYSSYYNRRWGAHSGSDSDDWFLFAGYLSDKLIFIPSINYERHGIVSNRPAEVKIEIRFDIRYKVNNTWFGIYYEKQNEIFLGFPDYFYEDKFGNPIDSSTGILANSRLTNTLHFSINKIIEF